MPKTPHKHIAILIGIIVVVVSVGNIMLGLFLQSKRQEKVAPLVTQTPVATQAKVRDYFSYQGKDGSDALTLLKEKATVEQNTSGLVSSINDRKADGSKHEYWAFYVNGQLVQVGPADYKTKDGDKIEWKIETY